MKHIIKQEEPKEFADWKALENEDWKPTYEELSGKPKQSLKAGLMQEQGFICCYCERRLTDADSHIEHFRPQSDPEVDPLDYGNLLCSCQKSLKKGEPRHCGNLKGDWFDDGLLVSPLEPGCEGRFSFTGDGVIKETREDDIAAKATIEKLGLNIKKLRDLRSSAIELFLDESLSPEDLQAFVTGYLKPPAPGGELGEFWTTIHHIFGDYAAL